MGIIGNQLPYLFFPVLLLKVPFYSSLLRIYVQLAAGETVVRPKNQIEEKVVQIRSVVIDSFLQVCVIGTHQSIPEIPGMVFEESVVHIQTQRA